MLTVPTNASGVTGEPGVVGVIGVPGLTGVVGETGHRVPDPSTKYRSFDRYPVYRVPG